MEIKPRIYEVLPKKGASLVPNDTIVSVIFMTDMEPTSINTDTFIVTDSDFRPIQGSVKYIKSNKTAIFTPKDKLKLNNTYMCLIVGDDDKEDNIIPGVTDIYGNGMKGSFRWKFTTDYVTTSSGNVPQEDNGNVSEEQNNISSPLQEVSGVSGSGYCPVVNSQIKSFFNVVDTYPENYEANVSAKYFEIMFDSSLNICTIPDGIDIKIYPFNGDKIKFPVNKLKGQWKLLTTHKQNDTIRYIGQDFLPNNRYEIKISNKRTLKDINGSVLSDEFIYIFGTELNPLWGSIEKVRYLIGSFIKDVKDFTIYTSLFENTLKAQRKILTGRNKILKNNIDENGNIIPPDIAVEWVLCKTIKDLLFGKILESSNKRNTSKSIGDFSVNYGTTDEGDIEKERKRLDEECSKLEEEFQDLLDGDMKYPRINTTVKAEFDPMNPIKGWRPRFQEVSGGIEWDQK